MIQGESMEPTYHNYQIVILDKRQPKEYQVGDVIAFNCEGLNSNLVKRTEKVRFVEETGELCYYVLGDNGDASVDSRDERVGWISENQIFGKVMFPQKDRH